MPRHLKTWLIINLVFAVVLASGRLDPPADFLTQCFLAGFLGSMLMAMKLTIKGDEEWF